MIIEDQSSGEKIIVFYVHIKNRFQRNVRLCNNNTRRRNG